MMKSFTGFSLSVYVLILILSDYNTVSAQVFPADFSQVRIANGITNPTVMAFASDGRIFIAQQNGALRIIKNGALLPAPFISLSVNSSGERGLIGIALDPDFATNNYIYLYYTVANGSHNRLSRFTANGDVVLANSESVVLDLDPLSTATNHNGGALAFAPDGKLFVAVGENAKGSNAQNLDTYLGKILRINKDGSVPAGNPFTEGSAQKKRIWVYGLRNPYTIAFQPVTGKFFVNDVGQNTWEEVNDATTAGKNFGWPSAEGMSTNTQYTNPVYVYGRGSADGNGCAITGGTFFNPVTTNYPGQYIGKYFLMDFCNKWINFFDPAAAAPARSAFATAVSGDGVSITAGIDGHLYYLSRSAGALYKIVYNPVAIAPSITQQPSAVSISEGETATFSVNASGSAPLAYQWKKNGADLPNATSAIYTISNAQSSHTGNYKVTISNATGSVTSNEVPLVLIANNAPGAVITTPKKNDLYTAGTTLSFSGAGTDAEDGDLPASAFSWQIDFHHDVHKHDQPALTGIKSGTFKVPVEGEVSANVWYRFILTVTDSDGAKAKDSVDVFPQKTKLDFTTVPAGLQIILDGQPLATPASVVSVRGIHRELGIITPQVKEGIEYRFASWSQGGEATQALTTPSVTTVYTANFSPVVVGLGEEMTSEVLQVYPNPVKEEHLYIRVESDYDQDASLFMLDPLSRTTKKVKMNLLKGTNHIPVYVGDLNAGMYALSFKMNGRSVSRRVLVVK